MRISPEQGLQFSQMLVQDEEPLSDITQVKKHLYYVLIPHVRLAKITNRFYCVGWFSSRGLFRLLQYL